MRELIITLTLLVAASSGLAQSFQGLGDFSGGSDFSIGMAISADGSTVVGYGNAETGERAFRWTAETGMVDLGEVPGGSTRTQAYDVSADGSVIVGPAWGNDVSGFRWTLTDPVTGAGTMQNLLGPSGQAIDTYPTAVSDDGSVVGGWWAIPSDPQTAFRWDLTDVATGTGQAVNLSNWPDGIDFYVPWGISPDGSMLVGGGKNDGCYAIVDQEVTTFGASDALRPCSALDATAGGAVIVGWAEIDSDPNNPREAFRWTAEGGTVGLGDLPGGELHSTAWAVSADGATIVGVSTAETGAAAFIWDQVHGMRNLNDVLTNDYGIDLDGWYLSSAKGISADGLTIVGHGINPDGNVEAWVATVPEPATISLLALGGLALLRRRPL
jgi:probable HAF family extracellular repeat protein